MTDDSITNWTRHEGSEAQAHVLKHCATEDPADMGWYQAADPASEIPPGRLPEGVFSGFADNEYVRFEWPDGSAIVALNGTAWDYGVHRDLVPDADRRVDKFLAGRPAARIPHPGHMWTNGEPGSVEWSVFGNPAADELDQGRDVKDMSLLAILEGIVTVATEADGDSDAGHSDANERRRLIVQLADKAKLLIGDTGEERTIPTLDDVRAFVQAPETPVADRGDD